MKSLIAFLCTALLICSLQTFSSEKQYTPDRRAQLPAALDHAYFGMGADYTDFPYSNNNLLNGIRATSFTNPTFGLNVFLGKFFNPYIAGEISLMRPIKWAYANGITAPNSRNSIWISVFGVTARPTLPLSKRFSIYGIGGLGLISRHGFSINQTTAIPSKVVPTFLTGGGVTYAITPAWHFDLGVRYTLAQPQEQQPHTVYAYGGFYYLFHQLNLPKYYNTHYIFQKNEIQAGGFSTNVFNPNVNKYFTVGYLPIFWTGDLKTRNGGWVMYERNVFHTHKRFSLDVGTSISTYHTALNNTSFQAFSVFPQIRVWLIRAPSTDMYFVYSIAGPTYLTRDNMDNVYLGGHFTFQDTLGFGVFLGREKHFNVDCRIAHYSNGNTLPVNPGVEVPMIVSLGYAF